MIKTYVKCPVEIQAVQWTGENFDEVFQFIDGKAYLSHWMGFKPKITIPTLEGVHMANVGDYIIRGVKGEFYPCKPDIFEETYEEVPSLDESIVDRFNACPHEYLIPREEIERILNMEVTNG